MKRLIIIPLVLLAFQLAGQRSFTQLEIDSIDTNNQAAEGDLYYNTDNGKLCIGLMDGTLYCMLNSDVDTVDYDWLRPTTDDHALDITNDIYTLGNVGIGTTAPPTNRLEVDDGTVRFSDYGVGNILDTLVATASPHPFSKFHLGVDSLGNVIEVNTVKSAKVFYPPSIVIDVSAVSMNTSAPGDEMIDLYDEYVSRFGMPLLSSPSGPDAIPTYSRNELYYYVTDLDTSVFDNYSLDDNGNFSYDVINVPAGNCTWINVVFVVK